MEPITELEKRMSEKNKEIDKLNKIIDILTQLLGIDKEIQLLKKPKGSQCSISGGAYEKKIYGVVKKM